MQTYDLVVIGAGLAGLSAVTAVSQGSDATIALVEGRSVGSNAPTPMTFADTVQEFSLEDYVLARYRRFAFHSPLGNKCSHSYEVPALVALDYRGACAELLRRAQAAGHVDLVSATASHLERLDSGRWHVRAVDGRSLTASLLIDASGRGLFAVGALGLPGPRMFSHSYGQILTSCAIPDPEEALYLAPSDAFGNGGGWFYPLDGGRVSFGFATLGATSDFPTQALQQRLQRARSEFAPYSHWLAEARVEHAEMGSIPVFPPRRFVRDGLMLVGDAASQASLWACMGTEPALISGRMAGETAVEAYRHQDYSRATLGDYQRRWDEAYRRVYRQAAWLAPVIWQTGEVNWNRQLAQLQQLSSEQMLARLRSNWPLLPWWKIAFIRAYDWAGRVRRGLTGLIR